MQPSTVLAVLAELAPAAAERTLDVTRGSQALVWLGTAERAPRKAPVDRLAALDALHREERILHRGWGFLAGSHEIDGKTRKIRVPLLSQPVHLERALTGYRVVPAGDVEVTPLVADRRLAAAMESAPGLATPGWLDAIGSRAWLRSVAEATGLPFDAMTEPGAKLPNDRLVLVTGAALFVVRDVFGAGLSDSLRSWAARDLRGTALEAVYGAAPARTGDVHDPVLAQPAVSDDPVLSPLPLNDDQARVVTRARTAPVTVVSGPPGSGKSHTVVAAALEVVDRGGSVLVATQSAHAAEVLAGLLARYPGPAPVRFGDAGGRAGLEGELTAGADQGIPAARIRAAREAVQQAAERVREERSALTDALDAERYAAQLSGYQPLLPALAADVPGAFADDVDLTEARRLLGLDRELVGADRSRGRTVLGVEAGGGWWARWRARVARRKAYRMLGARKGVPENRVTEAISAAVAQRAAARLTATGGTDLAARWAALHAAESDLRTAVGNAMRDAARSAERWDRDARRAAGALAAALRAGRNRRRELLARMDAPPLVRALPLWIGTVADVEDLLPSAPGLFDLVVIDEASHVDQIRAAPVLARARRALIVGDPRQLRFVSFVSDVDVAQVLDRHGADERLDVRRVSAYDLAVGTAPATWLAEHHRSVPHLIDFPARRFYGGRVSVMTRTPLADATDAIEVVQVPPTCSASTASISAGGQEVATALRVVLSLAAAGHRGIGVITPFRAQAEALESALVAALPAEQIEALGLRVGTVHAFQGSEADVVVVSLGLADGDPAGRRRFVTDPALFNVMVTRARRRLVLLTSLSAPDGLLADYLAHAATALSPAAAPPPALPGAGTRPLALPAGAAVPAAPVPGWAMELAAELERLGVPVRLGYDVGPWLLDLCVGEAPQAIGVLCGVHPDGTDAHLARQGALHRAGWRLMDAFPSRWHGDPRRAALEIATAVAATDPAPVH